LTYVLYVAAKVPKAGFAKTRLGRSIGHEEAVLLYEAFLRDLSARFSEAPFELGWYITPPDSWPEISRHTGGSGRVVFQGEDDWTARQRELFEGAEDRGEERIVLIGSDSPHLSVAGVSEAFELLETRDLVLRPTYDGGYCLIGMRGFQDVLRGVPMSTGTELDGILERARWFDLSLGLQEPTFDVDEQEDLRHLRPLALERSDLAETRRALRSLGLLEGNLLSSGTRYTMDGEGIG
jgi:rSAM/selenodomain-associated transferase 1